MNEITGQIDIREHKFAIVASRFNDFIVEKLVAGTHRQLLDLGANDDNLDLFWVPGAYETPAVASRLAASDEYAAVVCLGAVIRGATPHFDYVAGEAAHGIAEAARAHGTPVIFGILTTDTVEQAMERAIDGDGNKGAEAATAAVQMLKLYSGISNRLRGARSKK